MKKDPSLRNLCYKCGEPFNAFDIDTGERVCLRCGTGEKDYDSIEDGGEKMGKYLVLVEIDVDKNLVKTCEAIGAIGEHVTVEKAVNMDYLERIEGVQVWGDSEDVAGDPLPTVAVVQSKFSNGQWVDVILLPGNRPE